MYKTKIFFLTTFFVIILSGQISLNQTSNNISDKALIIFDTDTELSILLSRQALVADPGNSYAWAVAGNILRKNKRYNEAESYFKKSLEINPFLKEGLYWSAENNISLNNFDDAKEKLVILKSSCSGCNELKMLQSSLNQKEQQAYQNSISKNENLDE